MSLINQVLKDLEKRHANASENGAVTRGVRALPEDRSRRGLWIGLAAITIAIIAGAAWWWTMRGQDAVPPIAAKKTVPAAPMTNAPTVAQPAVTGAVTPPPAAPVNGAAVAAPAPEQLGVAKSIGIVTNPARPGLECQVATIVCRRGVAGAAHSPQRFQRSSNEAVADPCRGKSRGNRIHRRPAAHRTRTRMPPSLHRQLRSRRPALRNKSSPSRLRLPMPVRR
jgi:hypothetical protein